MRNHKRKFIGVSIEAVRNRIVLVGTSAGPKLWQDGRPLSADQVIAFLQSLYNLRRWQGYEKARLIFVSYASTRDLELLIQDFDPKDKDALFAGEYIVTAEGYRLQMRQGKSLSVFAVDKRGKAHKGVTFYDIYTFFRKPLPRIVRTFLGDCPPALERDTSAAPWRLNANPELTAYNTVEVQVIADLARRLDISFQRINVNLEKWYGPSAVANTLLYKWEARRQFRAMTEDNTPAHLWKAVTRAFYGGRQETPKVGTVYNVHVYDLNGAYGFAASLLGQAWGRWQYTRTYTKDLFSIWFVEYRLPPNAYVGALPHRLVTGAQVFRRSGRGYYWQPEVDALIKQYPDHVKVHFGYIQPYKRVRFGPNIEQLYAARMTLQEENDPVEKILKLVLTSIYGKFAQTIGRASYHFLPWAGWITSYVRAMLLQAIAGHEQSVIAFAQDAVHTNAPLNLPISREFGAWKLSTYAKGLYLENGIYELYDAHGNVVKRAQRGFQVIDFSNALMQLQERFYVKASREYFVGWRLARNHPAKFGGYYLARISEPIYLEPARARYRNFDPGRVDYYADCRDSSILQYDDGRESAMKRDLYSNDKLFDMMLDVIKARRY